MVENDSGIEQPVRQNKQVDETHTQHDTKSSKGVADGSYLELGDLAEQLDNLVVETDQPPGPAIDDPVDFLRNNITPDLHHYLCPKNSIKADVMELLTTTLKKRADYSEHSRPQQAFDQEQ